MNLPQKISPTRRQAGSFLIECLVYISVFAILLGIGTAVFYFCWDHTQAVIAATDDTTSALHAGERWRADVRGATGAIRVETNSIGETVRIPQANGEVCYQLANGELRREITATQTSWLLLKTVKTSEMHADPRRSVTAWRWELELAPRRKGATLPLRFSFAAVPTKP